ncbi:Uncharacterised protein [Mycobacteroides abscessus subsp. abscessus]|nr:Uncharacterised protein [Mycobacteroides abscessus subsp. abscessus]
MASSGVTVTPAAVASTSSQTSPAGRISRPSGSAPRTNLAVPVAACPSKAISELSARPAVRCPEASASSSAASVMTRVASAVVATGPGTSAAAASSTITHRSAIDPPAPPRSSGTATPKVPSSTRPSYGPRQASAPFSSAARTAAMEPDATAQLRTISRTSARSESIVVEVMDTMRS